MSLARWNANRRLQKIAGDLLLVTGSYWMAFYLRFDGYVLPAYWELFLNSLPLVLLSKLALLHFYRLHDTYWRYTSFTELIDLLKAITMAEAYFAGSYWLIMGFEGFPRSIFVLDWFFSLVAVAGFRALPRIWWDHGPARRKRKAANGRSEAGEIENVVLYGAGHLGASLARQIQEIYPGSKRVLGFLDDDPGLRGARIHGAEVLGGLEKLEQLAGSRRIDEVIITISAISGQDLHRRVDHCRKHSERVLVAPGLNEVFEGRVQISDLRDFQIEDLLGREPAEMDDSILHEFLEGKTVLVTGAGGSIGSEVCFQILRFHPERLILFGRGENSIYQVCNRLQPFAESGQLVEIIGDIINYPKFEHILQRYRPDLIFHAGADKHVPLMELNPDEAVLNNIVGTQSVLRAANEYGVEKVVCISSDKAVNPTSVMGCCKRVAELLIPQYSEGNTVACAVRFGNVLGSRGSVIPLFRSQIARGGPITITHPDIIRYFMTIPEAVLLVLKAGAVSRGGEVFVLDMGEPIKIVNLARHMIRLSGLDEKDVPIEFVGLRPGEKLFEELTYRHETLEATDVPKVRRAQIAAEQLHRSRPEILNDQIERLRWLAIEMNFPGIQKMLAEVVPEYEPVTDYAESLSSRRSTRVV